MPDKQHVLLLVQTIETKDGTTTCEASATGTVPIDMKLGLLFLPPDRLVDIDIKERLQERGADEL